MLTLLALGRSPRGGGQDTHGLTGSAAPDGFEPAPQTGEERRRRGTHHQTVAEEEARGRRAGRGTGGAGGSRQSPSGRTWSDAIAPPEMGQSSSRASGGGAAAAERRVRGEVEGRGVTVFSKTTCGYCVRGECPPPLAARPRALGGGG